MTDADGVPVGFDGSTLTADATQAVLSVEPDTPSVPELLGQVVHKASPIAVLKVSALHAVHDPEAVIAPLIAPLYPLAHKQSLGSSELGDEMLLSGHFVQCVSNSVPYLK